MSDLRKGSFASILLVLEQGAKKMIGLVSTLILARVIMPEDFGIIAIALLVTGFVDILSTTGSEDYLLRVDKLDDDKINTAWTINFILKTIVSLLMIAGGFWAADYYSDPRLVYIISAYAMICFVYSLKNPGMAYLRRAQEYSKIVKLSLITKTFAVIATITAALTLQNYWALVIGAATAALSLTIGSHLIYPYRRRFQLSNAKEQWAFSGWMIPQAIFGYIRSQLDTFLVSSTFGQAALGSYHTIKYIAFMPSEYLLTPMTRPFMVELTKSKTNKNYFNKQYNASFILIMLIAAPISSIMYFYYDLVTLMILGPNWLDYSYLMAIFSLLIPCYIMLQHATRVLILYGKTKQVFQYQIMAFFFIYSPLLIIGIDDLRLFSLVRVAAEIIMSFILLAIISIIYTGFKNSLLLLFSFLPISLSVFTASFVTSIVGKQDVNVFIDLSIITFTFTLVFYLSILIIHMLFLHRLTDWKYLESLVLRIIKPTLKKLIKKS